MVLIKITVLVIQLIHPRGVQLHIQTIKVVFQISAYIDESQPFLDKNAELQKKSEFDRQTFFFMYI